VGGVTWLDWQDEQGGVKLVVRSDGSELHTESADDDGIRGLVRLSDARVLRRGAIGQTALAILGRDVVSRLPARALLLDECKWRARAELDGRRGWAIHETVTWP
jgi:hypothetical protein